MSSTMLPASGDVFSTPSLGPGARYLQVEAHLKAIGLWFCLSGAFTALAGLVRALLAVPGFSVPLALVCGALGGGVIALGHFLRRFSNRARVIARVLSGLAIAGSVLSFWRISLAPSVIHAALAWVLSTAWAWALFRVLGAEESEEICEESYRRIALGRPGRSPATSFFFWAPLVSWLLAFGLRLAAPAAP